LGLKGTERGVEKRRGGVQLVNFGGGSKISLPNKDRRGALERGSVRKPLVKGTRKIRFPISGPVNGRDEKSRAMAWREIR